MSIKFKKVKNPNLVSSDDMSYGQTGIIEKPGSSLHGDPVWRSPDGLVHFDIGRLDCTYSVRLCDFKLREVTTA